MARLLFEKTGNSVWISHLDLMRLFQRAFKRAGLPLKHTQGFNPRPSVSIALPLSVGVESVCELLDFDLEADFSPEEIQSRLNAALVDGVRVRSVYTDGKKLKYLALLGCTVKLEYDSGVPSGAPDAIQALFDGDNILVEKKGKSGTVEQDIRPMIRSMTVSLADSYIIRLTAVICCQNPTLNPNLLVSAIQKYLPPYAPDFARIRRDEIYDEAQTIFR